MAKYCQLEQHSYIYKMEMIKSCYARLLCCSMYVVKIHSNLFDIDWSIVGKLWLGQQLGNLQAIDQYKAGQNQKMRSCCVIWGNWFFRATIFLPKKEDRDLRGIEFVRCPIPKNMLYSPDVLFWICLYLNIFLMWNITTYDYYFIFSPSNPVFFWQF